MNVDAKGELSPRAFGSPRSHHRTIGVMGQASVVAGKDHLYVLGKELQVFSLKDMNHIHQVARLKINESICVDRFQPVYQDDFIFTSRGVLDVRHPTKPKVVIGYRNAESVSHFDGLVYKISEQDYMAWEIDGERELKLLKQGKVLESKPRHILVAKGYVFMSFSRKDITIYKIESDYGLTLVSSFSLPGKDPYIGDLKYRDGKLWVAMNGSGIACFSLEDIQNPQLHAVMDTSQFSEKVYPYQDVVYSAEGSGGVLVTDMKQKGAPRSLFYHVTCDWTSSLTVYRGYIFTSESEAGVSIFISPNLNLYEPADEIYGDLFKKR